MPWEAVWALAVAAAAGGLLLWQSRRSRRAAKRRAPDDGEELWDSLSEGKDPTIEG